MPKPDKYQKTKFSREKKQASSEEDIIRNNAELERQKEVRKAERQYNTDKSKGLIKEEKNEDE